MKTLDLILIVGIGGILIYILSKSGIFKLASSTSDLASNVIGRVDKVTNDIVSLPENIATLIGDIPDIQRSIGSQIEGITGWDLPWLPQFDHATATDRAKNIVSSMAALYPNMTTQQQTACVARDNISFDANGYPIPK